MATKSFISPHMFTTVRDVKTVIKSEQQLKQTTNLEGETVRIWAKETINNIKFVIIRQNRAQSRVWLDLNVCARTA